MVFLQTKVLTAVRQKEREAEAEKKKKQDEQHQQKKKSNFGFFRRFQKAFRSTSSKDGNRAEPPPPPPHVIENPAIQPQIALVDEDMDSSMNQSVNTERGMPSGTVISESFVMVKPAKDNDKGIRRLKSVMGPSRASKLQAEGKMTAADSPMVHTKTDAIQDEPINDGGTTASRPGSRVLYPLVPRTSRSLPPGSNLDDNQPKLPPPVTNPRSSSLPAKSLTDSPDPWLRRSGADQDSTSAQSGSISSGDSNIRSRSCSGNSRSSLPKPSGNLDQKGSINTSHSSITSRSSAESSKSEGSRFLRLSAKGKRPRLASSRGSLSPPPINETEQKPPTPPTGDSKLAKPPPSNAVKSKLQAPRALNNGRSGASASTSKPTRFVYKPAQTKQDTKPNRASNRISPPRGSSTSRISPPRGDVKPDLVYTPNVYAPKSAEPQCAELVYRPNPGSNPLAFRDHNRNNCLQQPPPPGPRLGSKGSKPAAERPSRLPSAGKENSPTVEAPEKPVVLKYYSKGSSNA